MNFQVTILKVLMSYPDGFASLEDVKREVAILATSGREWSERTKGLAARLLVWKSSRNAWSSVETAAGASPMPDDRPSN